MQTRERIDWAQVAALYRRLVDLTGSPVVGAQPRRRACPGRRPRRGVHVIDRLDLDGYLYFHSTRGELLRRLGPTRRPERHTAEPWTWPTTTPQRRFLTRRLEEL